MVNVTAGVCHELLQSPIFYFDAKREPTILQEFDTNVYAWKDNILVSCVHFVVRI